MRRVDPHQERVRALRNSGMPLEIVARGTTEWNEGAVDVEDEQRLGGHIRTVAQSVPDSRGRVTELAHTLRTHLPAS